ncbi:MAG TPA: hypothetical protein VHN14_13400, partial [Kofleriaceae bacterium]|nr:hypothetical protein [Kofleriaceae bacterium]
EISCDAIFAHVTDGIVHARKAGLHERIIDFMHMHHGDGVLEYFWAKCCEQGNPHNFRIEDFRYPGHPPQSRETAILAICDAVEAASRTLKKPDAAAIDALVQRIVYGKLHLGQLDESGLSMSDLRQINDSLRETIRHANHGRIEYPWQKAEQDASASVISSPAIAPRLDSLDRKPDRDPTAPTLRLPSGSPTGSPSDGDAALATTADVNPASEQRIPITANGLPPNLEPRRGAGPARDETDAPDSGSTARGFERGAIPTVAPTPIRQVPATIPGRAPGPLPPPPAVVSAPGLGLEPPPAALTFDDEAPPAAPTFDDEPPPAVTTFDDEVSPAAIASDKTLPLIAIVPDDAILKPPALGSPPNAQPPRTTGLAGDDRQPRAVATLRGHAGAIAPALPAMPAMFDRGTRAPDAPPAPPPGGATPAVAVTPPTAAPTSETHLASRLSAYLHGDEARVTAARAATTSRRDHAAQVTEQRHAAPDPELDARITEPSMPVLAVGDELRVDLVLPSVPSERAEAERQTTWAHGLAARIDAALESDEWNLETPILAPTRAELRVLRGQPDPTRPQPVDEIAVLQRRAAELGGGDPPRRSPHPTTEVDPDDIEAAIEIAPPARRPTNANAIGAAKPKKPE